MKKIGVFEIARENGPTTEAGRVLVIIRAHLPYAGAQLLAAQSLSDLSSKRNPN